MRGDVGDLSVGMEEILFANFKAIYYQYLIINRLQKLKKWGKKNGISYHFVKLLVERVPRIGHEQHPEHGSLRHHRVKNWLIQEVVKSRSLCHAEIFVLTTGDLSLPIMEQIKMRMANRSCLRQGCMKYRLEEVGGQHTINWIARRGSLMWDSKSVT